MQGDVLTADFLKGYDLVLTPNIRSARLLGAAFAHTISADILPWHAWTTSLWQDLVLAGIEDRVLLNEAQTASLWEQVLADAGPAVLRPVRSIVELCIGAHRLLCNYGGLNRVLSYADEMESDTGAFALWLQEFERRCRDARWIAPAALERYAANALRSGRIETYQDRRCLLYGFDPLHPAQEDLLQALEAAGASVQRLPAAWDAKKAGETPAQALTGCANEQVEFRHVARVLEELLQEGVRGISVVLPSGPEIRGKLERELRTRFLHDSWDAALGQGRAIWEFSEGVSLSSVSLVRDALLLLDWLTEPQSPDVISQVLRSPYFQLGIEMEQAGELDARVLRNGERILPDWSVSALAWSAERRAPRLAEVLRALQAHAPSPRLERRHSDWTDAVRALLKAAGWPGTRERTSYEFQAVDRWDDLLDQVNSLDTVAGPLPFGEYHRVLRHMCGAILFSPQNTGAPIQIMSPSESEGTTAEVLLFAGATEEQWNGKRSLHPLLPFSLQKEFGMPGTDALRDDATASLVTQRIVQNASRVSFSYSIANKDGAVRPSTLVTRIRGLDRLTLLEEDVERPRIELQQLEDDTPLPGLPDSTVSGGVSILQHQAACAFRAFAERRLFSSELDTVDLGMEPRERGSVLHKALQYFWDRVRSQKELHRHMRENTLEEEIERAVDGAIPNDEGAEPWTGAYLEIQRERLMKLLRSWLLYEAERPPFEVLHTEHEIKGVHVGPLRMTMRVDRIDRVDDAGQPATVLIDYKTGNPDVKGWLGDRPSEPQLPLYASAAGFENVQAIAFATVKPGKKNLGLKPFPARSRLLFQGAKEKEELAFEYQLPAWRETLETLASDFAIGHADVRPKEYPATCQWCAQRMLCRLNPELLDDFAEEDEEDEVTS